MLDGQVSDAVEARSGIDTLLPSYSGVNTLLILFSPPVQSWILSLYSSPLLFRAEYSPCTLLPSYSWENTLLILFTPPIQGWILSLYSSPLLFRAEYSPYTLLLSSSGLNTLLIIFELFSLLFRGELNTLLTLSKEWCILGLYLLS